jgi:elongation factor Ts
MKKAGAGLVGFARFQLGEGIARRSDDFAAEVAAVASTAPKPPAA